MKSKSLHYIGNRLKALNRERDNKPLTFLICLGIASVIWLVNELGKTFDAEIDIPVKYSNIPKDRVLLNNPPSTISVRLNARGFSLLKNSVRVLASPISIDVESCAKDDNYNRSESMVLNVNKFASYIVKQMGNNTSVMSIYPETITLQLDEIIMRKKPVEANFDLSFIPQFDLYSPISFKPDSVDVCGPKTRIDTLKSIKTEYQKFRKLSNTKNGKVNLIEPEGLELQTKKAKYTVPVSIYSEYTAQIPVSARNVPEGLSLLTFPGSVKISCQVAVPNYNSITPSSFLVSVDYLQTQNDKQTLSVEVLHAPQFIRNLKFSPSEIEYLIEKE